MHLPVAKEVLGHRDEGGQDMLLSHLSGREETLTEPEDFWDVDDRLGVVLLVGQQDQKSGEERERENLQCRFPFTRAFVKK